MAEQGHGGHVMYAYIPFHKRDDFHAFPSTRYDIPFHKERRTYIPLHKIQSKGNQLRVILWSPHCHRHNRRSKHQNHQFNLKRMNIKGLLRSTILSRNYHKIPSSDRLIFPRTTLSVNKNHSNPALLIHAYRTAEEYRLEDFVKGKGKSTFFLTKDILLLPAQDVISDEAVTDEHNAYGTTIESEEHGTNGTTIESEGHSIYNTAIKSDATTTSNISMEFVHDKSDATTTSSSLDPSTNNDMHLKALSNTFIFRNGTIVFWNVPTTQRKQVISALSNNNSLDSPMPNAKTSSDQNILSECMHFMPRTDLTRSRIQDDCVLLAFNQNDSIEKELNDSPNEQEQWNSDLKSMDESIETSDSPTNDSLIYSNQLLLQRTKTNKQNTKGYTMPHNRPSFAAHYSLSQLNPNIGPFIMDQLAFSLAMSHSVKLEELENHLDNLLAEIRDVPRLLEGSSPSLQSSAHQFSTNRTSLLSGLSNMFTTDRRSIQQKYGQLLLFQSNLVLYSGLLEQPDIFWEDALLESHYDRMKMHLDYSVRSAALNRKADYAKDVLDVLKTHLNERHSTRLEWLIIWLITVEVLFDSYHTFWSD